MLHTGETLIVPGAPVVKPQAGTMDSEPRVPEKVHSDEQSDVALTLKVVALAPHANAPLTARSFWVAYPEHPDTVRLVPPSSEKSSGCPAIRVALSAALM